MVDLKNDIVYTKETKEEFGIVHAKYTGTLGIEATLNVNGFLKPPEAADIEAAIRWEITRMLYGEIGVVLNKLSVMVMESNCGNESKRDLIDEIRRIQNRLGGEAAKPARYRLDVGTGLVGAAWVEEEADSDGEWVKWEDVKGFL